MQRPISIIWFERCYLGAVVLGLVNSALQYPVIAARMADNPSVRDFGPGFLPTLMIVGGVLSLAVSLLLWFLVVRKRQVVAKWIITGLFVLSLLSIGFSALMGRLPGGIAGVLAVVAFVLNAIAVWQLFRPDAEIWFDPKAPIDSAVSL